MKTVKSTKHQTFFSNHFSNAWYSLSFKTNGMGHLRLSGRYREIPKTGRRRNGGSHRREMNGKKSPFLWKKHTKPCRPKIFFFFPFFFLFYSRNAGPGSRKCSNHILVTEGCPVRRNRQKKTKQTNDARLDLQSTKRKLTERMEQDDNLCISGHATRKQEGKINQFAMRMSSYDNRKC